MACDKCNFKGYVVDDVLYSSGEFKAMRECPHCEDTRSFSQAVKAKYGGSKPQRVKAKATGKKVLAFRPKD